MHTAATAKHIGEAGNLMFIDDTQKMLVMPPELIGSYTEDFYWKRYKVQVSETSETALITALNNIMIGIRKFNKRTAISEFTRPATMCHMKLANSTKAYFNIKTKRWDMDIFIDIEWSTS